MQVRTLGHTGLTVQEIGVGGAQFGLKNYMVTQISADVASRLDLAKLHDRYVR